MRRLVIIVCGLTAACAAHEAAAPVVSVGNVAVTPATEVAGPSIEASVPAPMIAVNDPFSIESMKESMRVSFARGAKVDKGALKINIASVGGKMSKTAEYATSCWSFSLKLAANDLAACVGAGTMRKGSLVASMRVDTGAPKRVVLSGSPFPASVNDCLEKELENIDPIGNAADPEEPSERATVKLSFDVPADF